MSMLVATACTTNKTMLGIKYDHPTEIAMYFRASIIRITNTSNWPNAEATHAPFIPKIGMSIGVTTTQAIAPNAVVFMIKPVCIVVE